MTFWLASRDSWTLEPTALRSDCPYWHGQQDSSKACFCSNLKRIKPKLRRILVEKMSALHGLHGYICQLHVMDTGYKYKRVTWEYLSVTCFGFTWEHLSAYCLQQVSYLSPSALQVTEAVSFSAHKKRYSQHGYCQVVTPALSLSHLQGLRFLASSLAATVASLGRWWVAIAPSSMQGSVKLWSKAVG